MGMLTSFKKDYQLNTNQISEMNWYPNPTQLLGLNLNSYTNLTLQNHIAQRGLNLPFQLNQFQGKNPTLNESVKLMMSL